MHLYRAEEYPMTKILDPELFSEVRKPLAEATWLPKNLYLDGHVFSLEKERIFKKSWSYVGHVSSLRHAGDYFTVSLYGQPLLVTHGSDGVIRTFYNICRHRGMQVASGAGNAPAFSCPYHAWTFDNQGSLKRAPEMEATVGFDACKIKLIEVRTEIIHGMVFVNFDNEAEPLAPQIQDLMAILSPWNIAELEPIGGSIIEGRFNWKLMLENANEAYHVLAAHRSFEISAPASISYSTDSEGRAWMDLITPYSEQGIAENAGAPKFPNVPDWAHEQLSFYALHPQFLISVGAEHVITYTTHIEGPEYTRFEWTMYLPKSIIDRPDFEEIRPSYIQFMDQINFEDLPMCEGIQISMESDGWYPPRYSRLEKPVWQFHNWYADKMSK
jgi:phenylpropionate dioxygenase-like ring-hydroxylating dioxygenase large terminal subunit